MSSQANDLHLLSTKFEKKSPLDATQVYEAFREDEIVDYLKVFVANVNIFRIVIRFANKLCKRKYWYERSKTTMTPAMWNNFVQHIYCELNTKCTYLLGVLTH